jgi:hypothetical protein
MRSGSIAVNESLLNKCEVQKHYNPQSADKARTSASSGRASRVWMVSTPSALRIFITGPRPTFPSPTNEDVYDCLDETVPCV